MKAAAVHMDSILADIRGNEKRAEEYIREAKGQGSQLVVLPEFFNTGFACSKELIEKVIQEGSPEEKMKWWAKENDIIIGGSYLAFDGEDIKNTFGLVFPDGQIYRHSKDIPTMLENYAYIKGDTDSVFDTPIGRIGVALCWEQIRYDTIRRMIGKIDLCLAGSCWWGFSKADPIHLQSLGKVHHEMALQAPVTLAKLLHVPVIHASHHASYTGRVLMNPIEKETRTIYGATQIIDQDGAVVKRRNYDEEGGIVVAEVDTASKDTVPQLPEEAGYWIPDMPEEFTTIWAAVNKSCHSYYEMETKKAWNRSCNFADTRL